MFYSTFRKTLFLCVTIDKCVSFLIQSLRKKSMKLTTEGCAHFQITFMSSLSVENVAGVTRVEVELEHVENMDQTSFHLFSIDVGYLLQRYSHQILE